jgi:hypothetical protein
LKAGVKEVPFDLVADRAGDEAGQYLDMITTNQHRNPLTVLEEADALFAAKQAGATRTRLRRTADLRRSWFSGLIVGVRTEWLIWVPSVSLTIGESSAPIRRSAADSRRAVQGTRSSSPPRSPHPGETARDA